MEEAERRENAELARLKAEAAQCRRCPLFQNATQTVFGEGFAGSVVMLVGEQPGDQEDRLGRPFVGPAGHVLDGALDAAGLARGAVYVTNIVKHFKHEERGKRRLHKHPNRDEIEICRWWLDQELALVDPKLVVALGAAAAGALMRRRVVLSRERGRLLRLPEGRAGFVTIHPSAVLRAPEAEARAKARAGLVADLRAVCAFLKPQAEAAARARG